MNTTIGSIEFYDGTNWLTTNLIPTLDSVTGFLYTGTATTLTLAVTNATDQISVVFKEGSTTLATVNNVAISSGSGTVTVPSGVHGQTGGDTITISMTNQDGTPSSNTVNKTLVGAPTGGTITTSGSYRIHSFTSSGTFGVTNQTLQNVEYLVIAGGGGGGVANGGGGGGGAGGYRNSTGSENSGRNSSTESKLSLGVANYTVTIGAGGAGGPINSNGDRGVQGSSTVFGSITSIGGGSGGGGCSGCDGCARLAVYGVVGL